MLALVQVFEKSEHILLVYKTEKHAIIPRLYLSFTSASLNATINFSDRLDLDAKPI